MRIQACVKNAKKSQGTIGADISKCEKEQKKVRMSRRDSRNT